MVYKVIGLMSGSSLDGLDIVFTELQETAGKWHYEIINSVCIEYDKTWQKKLREAIDLMAIDYQLLHTEYGKFIGEKINEFIEANNLQHKVNLVSSHGHTTFHLPEKKMTHQLGEGAAIASETKLPVVSDLRSMDIAFGGQGEHFTGAERYTAAACLHHPGDGCGGLGLNPHVAHLRGCSDCLCC